MTDYMEYMHLQGKPHEGGAKIMKDLRGWEGGKRSGGRGRRRRVDQGQGKVRERGRA
jgi:hypothetical protein